MATFCKACGHPVRQGGASWVHYDEHITHDVSPVFSDEKFAHSLTQPAMVYSDRRSVSREDKSAALYLLFLFLAYIAIMLLYEYSPAACLALTLALIIYHFLRRR